MVIRNELIYDEIVDVLDLKYIAGSTIGYTLQPGIFEYSDSILIVKSLLPIEVRVKIKIRDIRLRSNLTTKRTINFT